MNAIVVHNLSKAYKRYPSAWGRISEWLTGSIFHQKRWALKDVSFEVPKGTAFGIIGVNGAGKSTLLKIITGTTPATTGAVNISGRIAALLELGMGFHQDFTGRENVLMSGQLLGLSLADIKRTMPEIEAFAGIGDFIDQPVRTYSSGMQTRLAFSVATAVRPDILIIDEALSVGDAAFQRKCFQRIENFKSEGSTLLFVSHDIEAVKRLCDSAIFIHEGLVAHKGSAREVCDAYERKLFSGETLLDEYAPLPSAALETNSRHLKIALNTLRKTVDCMQFYGNGEAEIEDYWLEDEEENPITLIQAGKRVNWCYKVRFNIDLADPTYSMMLKTRDGHAVFGTDSKILPVRPNGVAPGDLLTIKFAINTTLIPGNYYLNCGVRRDSEEGTVFMSRIVDAAILKVSGSNISSAAVGPADLNAQLTIL